jgi:hypothetical protein
MILTGIPTQNTGVLMGNEHNRIYIHLLLPSIKDPHSLMSGIVPLVGCGTDTDTKEPAIRDARNRTEDVGECGTRVTEAMFAPCVRRGRPPGKLGSTVDHVWHAIIRSQDLEYHVSPDSMPLADGLITRRKKDSRQ